MEIDDQSKKIFWQDKDHFDQPSMKTCKIFALSRKFPRLQLKKAYFLSVKLQHTHMHRLEGMIVITQTDPFALPPTLY